MIDFSSEKYSGSTRHRNIIMVPVEKFSVKMPMMGLKLETPRLQTECCIAQWLEHSVCNREVVTSSPIIGILTENFYAGTRSSCVQ